MAALVIQFLLDQNVPESVAIVLRERGHVVHFVRDVLAADSKDPLIATVSEENGWVLVSCDHDFDSIAPRIPKGSRARFRKLSRLSLACTEYQAAARLKLFINQVEAEYQATRDLPDVRMLIVIQNNGFKIVR
jgi:predicted nuclease of predicted toxin-antitoxin system